MYRVRKSQEFSAAHSLRDYDGPCARIHGHNYRVEVDVVGDKLDDQELLVDFYEVDRLLEPIVGKVDHQYINEIPPFVEINPTAEAIAAWFFRELEPLIQTTFGGRVKLAAIHLWETQDSCASFSAESAG
ncbi:MAG: 6-carboxytetrahydropterin synthase QueD [Candidatus Eisenbacteria bacterium]|uniref:6-carboxy-5,6,7,8-tetrahydropterin synthase n=1 Tax=Eiseniibacteriota bacterium TaxID=2212470 RepID=A0A7Y2E996_UNCEI|nr:6-carboxytetrahydropterin synthase QueD [Candidatus Eisenbacteria bacterium]